MPRLEVPRVPTRPRCSFCGKQKDQVARLIEHSPAAMICNECVALCVDIVTEDRQRVSSPPVPPTPEPPESKRHSADTRVHRGVPSCSFCGRSHDEVEKLIAGPDVNICDACVGQCDTALVEAIHAGQLAPEAYRAFPHRTATDKRHIVIEICFNVKADRIDEFAGTARIVLGHLFDTAGLDAANKLSDMSLLSAEDSTDPKEYIALIDVKNVTVERLSLLKEVFVEDAAKSMGLLMPMLLSAPRIRILWDESCSMPNTSSQ